MCSSDLMAEFLIGSLADARLGTLTAAADARLYAQVAERTATTARDREAVVRSLRISRDLMLGLAVLGNAELLPEGLDWRPLAAVIVSPQPAGVAAGTRPGSR